MHDQGKNLTNITVELYILTLSTVPETYFYFLTERSRKWTVPPVSEVSCPLYGFGHFQFYC